MGIAHDDVHAGQRSDFLGGALGVTSGHDDPGIGILAAHSADRSTGILIRRGGHSAGVQDNHRGVSGGRSANQSLLFELTFQSGAIGLSGATSEVFYKESSHTLW